MVDIDDVDLAEALEKACSTAAEDETQRLFTVATALRTMVRGEDDPLRDVVAGLEYELTIEVERRGSRGVFGALMEGNGHSYPPPLESMGALFPGIFDLWHRALRSSPLALVRARFADLLWEARYGDEAYRFAQIAIDSYIDASSDGFGHPVERSDAVRRGFEIAARISDAARKEVALAAAVDLTEFALASDDRLPGVALPLLALLVDQAPEHRPHVLPDLPVRVTERFGDDPWNLQAALELQARLVPPPDRAPLRIREVNAFRDLANRMTGLVRYAHLQRAIELAERHGLRDLADQIRKEVEGMSENDLELKEIAAEVTLPREEVDAFVAWFVADDLDSSLKRFGSHVPTGEPNENREYIGQLMADHPLQFIFTKITIGPENSTLLVVQSQDDHAEQAMIEHESQRASMFSIFAVDILQSLRDRHGSVRLAEAWFETETIERAVARKIIRAIELYEEGDFDTATSILAPRLERVIRRVASTAGLTVTRSPDRQGRSGGVKSVGEMLADLEGVLHEPTRRYLRVLLSEVSGLNLRNRVGHSLDDDFSQREAALLIHAACHLQSLRSEPARGGT